MNGAKTLHTSMSIKTKYTNETTLVVRVVHYRMGGKNAVLSRSRLRECHLFAVAEHASIYIVSTLLIGMCPIKPVQMNRTDVKNQMN